MAQAEADKGENEIVVAAKIVSELVLNVAIIVADAMHAQKTFSNQVVEAGADFVWTVKGNQSRTRWAIEKLFAHEVCNLQKGAMFSKDIRMAVEVKSDVGGSSKRRSRPAHK